MNQNEYLQIFGAISLLYVMYKGIKWLWYNIPTISNPIRKWVKKEVVNYLNELKDE
tara:strand:- start:1456 stop:1623 length:168 start_codon:yes stop_codon:yes gene_type:complete